MKAALTTAIIAICLSGCLSMDRRELLIQDIQAARQFIEVTLPPGVTRDRMLARLAAAENVEELLQVRAAVRAARAATQPAVTQ